MMPPRLFCKLCRQEVIRMPGVTRHDCPVTEGTSFLPEGELAPWIRLGSPNGRQDEWLKLYSSLGSLQQNLQLAFKVLEQAQLQYYSILEAVNELIGEQEQSG